MGLVVGFVLLRTETVTGCSKNDNGSKGFVKDERIL
jgi:hypothetical protein